MSFWLSKHAGILTVFCYWKAELNWIEFILGDHHAIIIFLIVDILIVTKMADFVTGWCMLILFHTLCSELHRKKVKVFDWKSIVTKMADFVTGRCMLILFHTLCSEFYRKKVNVFDWKIYCYKTGWFCYRSMHMLILFHIFSLFRILLGHLDSVKK